MPVIVDKFIDKSILSTLEENDITYYKTASLDYLYKPVNTHPDMQIHFVDDSTAVVAPDVFEYYKNLLPAGIMILKGKKNPGRTYPEDTAYNVAKVGKRIIGRHASLEVVIKEIYTQKGYDFVDVKQGYAKCNLCIVDENSVITEDEGLCNALTKTGIDVLKIQAGAVMLPGFKNGFLGGASGFVSKNKLAFCGNLENHPDSDKIFDFVKSKNVDIIQLSSTKLCDYGSILNF
ncbi:MAG: hypothetical protein IJE62_02365 [Clostridia bacterium]|nr:hypothetical protein [Clostridia bacterium]